MTLSCMQRSVQPLLPFVLGFGLLMALPAHADEQADTIRALKADMQRMLLRLEALEKRNAELEQAQVETRTALQTPVISQDEPEVATRLKAVESQADNQKKAAQLAESLEGIKVGASLTSVAQGASGTRNNPANPQGDDDALNYRADVDVSAPLASLGNGSESQLFAQFRIGQGRGIEELGHSFSSVNATTFQRPGTANADSTVLLAQAWYQVKWPLPIGGKPDRSREHLAFTVGKMDPFAFFDGSDIADDETSHFMNQAFVHNPLLDVGGDIGVDEFGFTPGMHLAYTNDTQKPDSYGVSMGVFGSDTGASYSDSLQSPLVMLQAETGQVLFDGLHGHYRLYGWHNGRATDIDGRLATHSGIGLSFDQQVHDYATVFARIGHQVAGNVRFDETVTAGIELGGSYWNRGGDHLGLAVGWLGISHEFHRQSLTLDADRDGLPDYGYVASGSERLAEMYYRWFFNHNLSLTPSLQYIQRPGGNGNADGIFATGLRLQVDY